MAEDKKGSDPASDGPNGASKMMVIAPFTIEIASSTNSSVMCPMTRKSLRGRWENHNVKGRMTEGDFARMPDLPGMHIRVDPAAKTITIYDGAGVPGFKRELEEAKAICKPLGFGEGPEPTITLKEVKEDRMKTQVYWCRRWIDSLQAVVVSGIVPEMSKIEQMPGRVEKNQFDSSPARDRFPNAAELPAYEPPPFARQQKND